MAGRNGSDHLRGSGRQLLNVVYGAVVENMDAKERGRFDDALAPYGERGALVAQWRDWDGKMGPDGRPPWFRPLGPPTPERLAELEAKAAEVTALGPKAAEVVP